MKNSKKIARPKRGPVAPCSALCPKCGSPDILRQFRRNGEEWEGAVEIGEYIEPGENTLIVWGEYGNTKAKRDIITHHCRCCQYDWQTPPIGG
jgi:hypothetical protein